MTLRPVLLLVAVALVAVALVACATPPTPAPAPTPPPAPLADACSSLYAEALANPSLQVDRAPDVVKYDPPPLRRPYPAGVIRRDGTTKVSVSVVVDTTGVARMGTFTVLASTHPWLVNDLKTKIPKWRFTPAYRNGCKVPGLWVFTATPGARTR